MRIVDRATFLAMPAGTVYAKYEPYLFDHLAIKGDTWPHGNDPIRSDFLYQSVTHSFDRADSTDFGDVLDRATAGGTVPMDFDTTARDGLFDEEQLFAVWDRHDVEALITRLRKALTDTGQGNT